MGPRRSEHSSNHFSRSQGMSEGEYFSFGFVPLGSLTGFRSTDRNPTGVVVFGFDGGDARVARAALNPAVGFSEESIPSPLEEPGSWSLSSAISLIVARRDLAGSTQVEPASASHVDVEGKVDNSCLTCIGAVSLGVERPWRPLLWFFFLSMKLCSSSRDSDLISWPFILMVRLPKSRHTP